MLMNSRNLLLTIFACLALSVSAQSEYKSIRTYIKKGGNIATVRQQIQKLEKDEDFKDDPKLYFLAVQSERKANEADNTKLYLNQAYDTVNFFATISGMFKYAAQCDGIEQHRLSNGNYKLKYRSKLHDILKRYYPNLYSAGIFYIKKKDYKNSQQYFQQYLDAAQSPIFAADRLLTTDTKLPRAAFWCMTSAYYQKDYYAALRSGELASRDSANADLYLQYTALSQGALKDTALYISTLRKGMKEIPYDLFFFSTLTDYYNTTHQYDKALQLTDSVQRLNPQQPIFKFAKSVVLYNLKRYDDCITLSREVISADSTNADAYFYAGSCYYNQAAEIDDNVQPNINLKSYNAQKQQVRNLFAQAKPYLERYRRLRPNDQKRWAPLLYRIYLNLNEAAPFAEIEKILNEASDKAPKSSK